MPMIRSFVAIELADEWKKALARMQSRLKAGPSARAARWVAPEAIHLTLKFLGDVPSETLPGIEEGMRRACAGHLPFDLALGHTGCFPNQSRPRVLWIGLDGDIAALAALQRDVEGQMEKLGFAREGRAFQPHLTLARVRDEASAIERADLGKALGALHPEPQSGMRVEVLSLMRSDLRREGAIYTQLAAVPLGLGGNKNG